jgi:hypothetical protein
MNFPNTLILGLNKENLPFSKIKTFVLILFYIIIECLVFNNIFFKEIRENHSSKSFALM